MVSVKREKEEREACMPLLVHGPLLLLTTDAAAMIKQQWQLNNISAISPPKTRFFFPNFNAAISGLGSIILFVLMHSSRFYNT